MFSYLVLIDGLVVSFVNLVGQGKYYVFLIYSLEKTFIVNKKVRRRQEIQRRMRMNAVAYGQSSASFRGIFLWNTVRQHKICAKCKQFPNNDKIEEATEISVDKGLLLMFISTS